MRLTSDWISTTVGILWKRKRDRVRTSTTAKIRRELPCKDLQRPFQSQICCPSRCQRRRESYRELPIKRKRDRVRTSTTAKIRRELPCKDLQRPFQSRICCPSRCQRRRAPYRELPIGILRAKTSQQTHVVFICCYVSV